MIPPGPRPTRDPETVIGDPPPKPSDPTPRGASSGWRKLHRDILACTRCVESGHIPEAAPVFQGRPRQPLMLVGQAPGEYERVARRPFARRSGVELARWMQRAGFRDDDHFRALTYVTSVTKCFPGKARSGSGDRRPSATEVNQCLPWLEAQLAVVRPRLLILVGGLAHERFLPGRGLDALVGRVFDRAGAEIESLDGAHLPVLVPLPHPSGASRWLNDLHHRELLDRALSRLADTWPVLVAPAT